MLPTRIEMQLPIELGFHVYVLSHRATMRHYVGFTGNVRLRWQKYIREIRHVDPRREQRIVRALRCYGIEAFDFVVIETWSEENDAISSEAFWIEFLRSNIVGFNGFNHALGTGRSHSAATRAKMSASHLGKKLSDTHRKSIARANSTPEALANNRARAFALPPCSRETRAKISKRLTGHPVSDETRARIGAANRNPSDETRAKMRVARLGTKMSDEARSKMRTSHLRRHSDIRLSSLLVDEQ